MNYRRGGNILNNGLGVYGIPYLDTLAQLAEQ